MERLKSLMVGIVKKYYNWIVVGFSLAILVLSLCIIISIESLGCLVVLALKDTNPVALYGSVILISLCSFLVPLIMAMTLNYYLDKLANIKYDVEYKRWLRFQKRYQEELQSKDATTNK